MEYYSEDLQPEKKKRWSPFKPRLTPPNIVLSIIVNTIRISILIVFLIGLGLAGSILGIAKGYIETAPTLDVALIGKQDKTSFFYDAKGNLITDYKGTENRIVISIGRMSENLCNAFVAVEDMRFYTHNGIDIKRIIGSFVNNLTSSVQHGGSTITQQLIKNTVLSSELSYKRKIQEAYLALQLENKYSKEQILESYLNTIYLGENYYGVQVASQGYFGKDPSQLSLRECAMLAGMTTNPYYYNPRRNFYLRSSDTKDYVEITNIRTDYVLHQMYKNQYITLQEYEQALNTETAKVLEVGPKNDQMYKYPHYVEYAVSEVIDVFIEQRGLENTSANRALMEAQLRTGGYHIKLAIDTEIQEIVEKNLAEYDNYPTLRDPSHKVMRTMRNDGTYEEVPQPQSAAVVIDYRTGEIKAIVGSREVPTQRKTLNRATKMKMPVGSSIKPIAVYAPALELGYSPASIAYNIPAPITGWRGADGKDTWPRNYGGESYEGPQTLRQGMEGSYNVIAAQTLLNYVSVDRSYDFLLRMGVAPDNIDKTPFGLSLGSSGITPMQLTTAYSVLANAGTYQEPISFLGISDSQGNVIYDSHANSETREVFRPSTAWMTVDMMKGVVNNGTASKAKISGQTVAGKTGTNSDERGITFAGMTGWYVSALWVGHDNYQPLSSKTTANSHAAPLWQNYMEEIHQKKQLGNRDIIEAEPEQLKLRRVTTCAVSGQLATEACYHDTMGYGTVMDYWYEPTVPTIQCQMHQKIELCEQSGQLPTEFCPSRKIGGVAVIPPGHPLSNLANSYEYGPVIAQYLGTGNSLVSCPIHQGQTAPEIFTPQIDPMLIADAQRLIQSAYELMTVYNQGSPQYTKIERAVVDMQNVLNSPNSTVNDVVTAMARMTKAMAGQ